MDCAKILHVDMDCFYAQVEMRDNPKLQEKPVIISGPPNTRSVVCTASYEARKYGVHSAMGAAKAYKLCPNGIFVMPNMDKYRQVSKEIHKIFQRYTNVIEPLSLDEAYLDLTDENNPISATLIAEEIKQVIYDELELTCSIGVSYNKFLAKIGSDYNKPNGITIIKPQEAIKFLEELPIERFPGVGRKAKIKMHQYAIYSGKDFKKLNREKSEKLFGKLGKNLHQYVRGVDNREVISNQINKSVGTEYTMAVDLETKAEIIKELDKIAIENKRRLDKHKLCFKTVTLKLKYADFQQITRSKTLKYYEDTSTVMYDVACQLLKEVNLVNAVRLVGITVSTLEELDVLEKQLKIEQITLPI